MYDGLKDLIFPLKNNNDQIFSFLASSNENIIQSDQQFDFEGLSRKTSKAKSSFDSWLNSIDNFSKEKVPITRTTVGKFTNLQTKIGQSQVGDESKTSQLKIKRFISPRNKDFERNSPMQVLAGK